MDPNFFKILVSMCSDTNWKIRKQAAHFLYDYLQPLHQMKKKSKKAKEEEKR